MNYCAGIATSSPSDNHGRGRAGPGASGRSGDRGKFHRWAAQFRAEAAALERELAMHTDLVEHRAAGRSLSLERAVDLALRVVEEERAAARLGARPSALREVRSPAESAPAANALPGACVFRREGDYWTITYADSVCRLKDARGLHYLAHLLRHPGQEFHVLDLVSAVSGTPDNVPVQGDAGPTLDAAAKAAYRQRLVDLREELAEAEAFNDPGRAARAREEIDALTEQLAAGVGLGGRNRVAGAAAELARSAVTQGIRRALERIGDGIPALGDQLAPRIRTGAFCVYVPDAVHPLSWTF
jgi:hypothetical protein